MTAMTKYSIAIAVLGPIGCVYTIAEILKIGKKCVEVEKRRQAIFDGLVAESEEQRKKMFYNIKN